MEGGYRAARQTKDTAAERTQERPNSKFFKQCFGAMTCLNAAQPLGNYVIDYKLCQHHPIKPSWLQWCWQSTCQLLSWKCKGYKVITLTGERRDPCFESQSGFIRNLRSRYSKGHVKMYPRVSTPPTENTECEMFALSGRKTRVMVFFRSFASYTGASWPKEK